MDFQGTLFAEPDTAPVVRHQLGSGAWVDVAHDWLRDRDEVYDALASRVPWRAERREMYDRIVDVPRLLHTYGAGESLPHESLVDARARLNAHYRDELGEEFVTAGCCLYCDGRDSVAWHGDRIGRGDREDTMVAIVSVGDPRRLALRPRGGGASLSFTMAHGDLVVMGGSCQRTG